MKKGPPYPDLLYRVVYGIRNGCLIIHEWFHVREPNRKTEPAFLDEQQVSLLAAELEALPIHKYRTELEKLPQPTLHLYLKAKLEGYDACGETYMSGDELARTLQSLQPIRRRFWAGAETLATFIWTVPFYIVAGIMTVTAQLIYNLALIPALVISLVTGKRKRQPRSSVQTQNNDDKGEEWLERFGKPYLAGQRFLQRVFDPLAYPAWTRQLQ